MPDLPLFPLNTVLFPGLPLKLNIFESRYKKLLDRCLESGEKFGVVLIKQGREALGPLAVPHLVGCTAQLVQVEETQDERYNITTIGRERFRILSLDRTTYPYLSAQVEIYPITDENEEAKRIAARKLRPWVKRYLEVLGNATNMNMDTRYLPNDSLALGFLATYLLQIPPEDKQKILEIEEAGNLLSAVLQLFRREVSLLGEMHARERENKRNPWLN